MNLSTKGRYAVRAMLALAHQRDGGGGCRGGCTPPNTSHEVVALSTISDRQSLPISYLEQLFNKLRRAGLVESVRGAGGGYRLARDPQGITIASIMMAAGETFNITGHDDETPLIHGGSASQGQPEASITTDVTASTHRLWGELGVVIHHYLESVTLADVMHDRVRVAYPACATSSDCKGFVPSPAPVDNPALGLAPYFRKGGEVSHG